MWRAGVALTLVAGGLLTVGCAQDGFEDIAIDSGGTLSDVDDCFAEVSDTVVRLDAQAPSAVVLVGFPCLSSHTPSILADDPDEAFSVQPAGTFGPEVSGTEIEVQIALLASEPGTYEAQLAVSPGENVRVIELIGTVEE